MKDSWDWKVSKLYKYVTFDKNMKPKPLLVWENLEILLKRKGITLKYNELSKSIEYFGAINSTLNNNATLEDTISKLRSIGITVDDFEPAFTEEELDIYYGSIKNGWWQEFCDDIHFYGAEDELYRQAMKDLPQNPEYSKYFTK